MKPFILPLCAAWSASLFVYSIGLPLAAVVVGPALLGASVWLILKVTRQ